MAEKRKNNSALIKRILCVVLALLIVAALALGVTHFAVTQSYESKELCLADGFTITAHSGAYDTPENSLEYIQTAIAHHAQIVEFDIRQRPDGTLIMAHDAAQTNEDGTPIAEAFALLKDTDIQINLDVKETATLDALYALLAEYDLTEQGFLTGIGTAEVDAVKASKCAVLDYYLNYKPSKARILSNSYRQELLDLLKETGAVGVNCEHKYATARLSDLLHENEYKLSVWTVDDEKDAKRALVFAPDNITTRHPDMIQSVIDSWGD